MGADDDRWQLSWQAFIEAVAGKFQEGCDEQEASLFFGGSTIAWHGRIKKFELDSEYAPGIKLSMPEALATIDSGKRIRTNYLFVSVHNPTHQKIWATYSVGDELSFQATISTNIGPLPGVRLTEPDESGECALMLALENGAPAPGKPTSN